MGTLKQWWRRVIILSIIQSEFFEFLIFTCRLPVVISLPDVVGLLDGYKVKVSQDGSEERESRLGGVLVVRKVGPVVLVDLEELLHAVVKDVDNEDKLRGELQEVCPLGVLQQLDALDI